MAPPNKVPEGWEPEQGAWHTKGEIPALVAEVAGSHRWAAGVAQLLEGDAARVLRGGALCDPGHGPRHEQPPPDSTKEGGKADATKLCLCMHIAAPPPRGGWPSNFFCFPVERCLGRFVSPKFSHTNDILKRVCHLTPRVQQTFLVRTAAI